MANKVELENDGQREVAELEFLRAGVAMLCLELEEHGEKFEDSFDEWLQGLSSRGMSAQTIAKLRQSWAKIVSGA